MEKSATKVINKLNEEFTAKETENENPFEAASQLQIQDDLNELKLKEQQSRLQRVENIREDVEDLHSMYSQLHEMVGDQREHVENIEVNVETTQENVDKGFMQIIKAHK